MVIFGGLEFIVGGYFVHRHFKKKNHKKRLEAEAEQRRHNTFPGANPQRPREPLPQYQQRPPMPHHIPRRPVPQRAQNQPRPHTAQTFPLQTQPQPHPQQRRPPHIPPHIESEIQPLQRSDSFTTLSDMPVANGLQYRPPLPLRPQVSNLQVPSQQGLASGPYSNAGFSVSVPAFERPPPSPLMGSGPRVGGTVDDNWETYSPHSPHAHLRGGGRAQEDGDADDPPPPYQP